MPDPIQELTQIKDQIESLKKKISAKVSQADMQNLAKLSDKLNNITAVFQHASSEMEKEPPEEDLDKLKESIEEIEEENKSIAKGIVVLAEMIKERLPEKHATHMPPKAPVHPPHMPPKPAPQPRPIPPPKITQPSAPEPHTAPKPSPAAAQPGPAPSPTLPPKPGITPAIPPPQKPVMPPPLKPHPSPVTLRREAPPLEGMPPPPKPPSDIGIPPPTEITKEKKGFFKRLFKK